MRNCYILEGPTIPNWRDYCLSLLEDAGKRVLKEHEYLSKMDPEQQDYISWNNITATLCILLQENGFTLLNPPETTFVGSLINESGLPDFLSPKLEQEMVKYNKQLADKRSSELLGELD